MIWPPGKKMRFRNAFCVLDKRKLRLNSSHSKKTERNLNATPTRQDSDKFLFHHVILGKRCLVQGYYYIATIVRALWLAAKRTLFSCNDRASLAMCPRHIQSVSNLIVDILMDIHVMVNYELSKRVSAVQCPWVYRGCKCTTHWGDVFLKLSAD